MTTKSTFVTHEIVSYWMRLFFTFVKQFLQHLRVVQWVESRLANVIGQNWCFFESHSFTSLALPVSYWSKIGVISMWHIVPRNWKHRMQISHVDDCLIQYMGERGSQIQECWVEMATKLTFVAREPFCKYWMRFNTVHVLLNIIYTTLLSEEILDWPMWSAKIGAS